MERTLSFLLVVSFAGIALFGFSAASGGVHGGCVADAFEELQGGACPVSENPFVLLASHLGSLRSFVGNPPAPAAAFFLLLTLAAVTFFAVAGEGAPLAFSFVRPFGMESVRRRVFLKRRRWTALHETNPTDFL